MAQIVDAAFARDFLGRLRAAAMSGPNRFHP